MRCFKRVSHFHNKCWLSAGPWNISSHRHGLDIRFCRELKKKKMTRSIRTSNGSQQCKLLRCHVTHYFTNKVSVFVHVKGHIGMQKISQTYVTDRAPPDSEGKQYIYWSLCCSRPSWDRQSLITVNTWAASRLYTPAPGALHLGHEAFTQLPFLLESCLEQADYR